MMNLPVDAETDHIVCCDETTAVCGKDVTFDPWCPEECEEHEVCHDCALIHDDQTWICPECGRGWE
jgi:hypothetical protein